VIGDVLLDQARRDGIDVAAVIRRRDTLTAVAVAEADANLFLWRGGRLRIPLTGDKVVDTTGGGDAFTAALTAALLRKLPYEQAAHLATAEAGATVSHISGRPNLHRPG
jgi:ribokinase